MELAAMIENAVSVVGLKRFALEELPSGPLRDDILSQPDKTDAEQFIADCRIWLRLARVLTG